MIPKVIHYCWFGRNPLPQLAVKCIESWKKYLPEYEIKEWNEDNFDVNIIPYTAEAYKMKKFAFVSDFVRLYVLEKYGGLYFDTDVEVLKPFDDILQNGPFLGVETTKLINGHNVKAINPGLGLGFPSGHPFLKEIIELYSKSNFYKGSGNNFGFKTIVEFTTEIMLSKGFQGRFLNDKFEVVDGIYIYNTDFFCPQLNGNKWEVLPNTYSIHHYAATWTPWHIRLKVKFARNFKVLYRCYKAIIK